MKSFRLVWSSVAMVALTLSIVLVPGASPASAESITHEYANIVFTADTEAATAEATVTGYTGNGGAVVIPASVAIGGVEYAITAIGRNAFFGVGVTSVTIPDGVTTIGYGAFARNELTSVELPASVTTMGSFAFQMNNLASANIPPGVTTLEFEVFAGNELRSVTIPDGVLAVEAGAFLDNKLMAVTIPASVSTIGEAAFAENPFLTDVLFLGPAPTVTDSEEYPGSTGVFGDAVGKVVWYVPAHASSFTDLWQYLWHGYTTVVMNTTTPTVAGVAQVGQTLTAHIPRWWTWSPMPVSLTYAWTRSDSSAVLGTDDTYEPTAADVNATVMVTITTTQGPFERVLSSAPTAAVALGVFANVAGPTITGTAQVGQAVSATTGSWATDATLAYIWKRSGSTSTIGSARDYTPVAADIGKTLTVSVTATRAGYTSVTTTSVATAVVLGRAFTTSPVPTITGTKKSGSTLTAVTTGWVPSTSVTFSYVWKRATTIDGPATTIAGATGRTYRLVTADRGKYITVVVTARKTGYASTIRSSAAGAVRIAS